MHRCAWADNKYLSSWLTAVRETAPVEIFVLKNVSLFSWYVPRILYKLLRSFHAAIRDSYSQTWVHCCCTSFSDGAFLSLVRKCLSALRQYRTLNCFLVGGHPMFFRIDRTENVDPWPSFSTQFNSFASSHCMAIVTLPSVSSSALPVRLNTHLSIHLHPSWDLYRVNILVGANDHMRIPFGFAPCENGRIPAYLTLLTDWYLWVLSLSVSPFFVTFRVPSRFIGGGTGFSYVPFLLFWSCLMLHDSPRQHWPSEVHCVQSSRFRSFCVLSIASRIFFWVPFTSCCSLKWPVFVAGIEMDLFFWYTVLVHLPQTLRRLLRPIWCRVEALHAVFIQLDSREVAAVNKSFACSTDLDIVKDHVSVLSSFHKSFVLLCLLLFRVDSPLEIVGLKRLESTRHFF